MAIGKSELYVIGMQARLYFCIGKTWKFQKKNLSLKDVFYFYFYIGSQKDKSNNEYQ